MQTSRTVFKSLIAGDRYITAPGAFDPLSARLVEFAGFEAVYMSGGAFSRANGYPDLGLLTLTEIAAWLARTVDVVGIPVIADADTGYGNALNVIRAVREFERAGVAAFHLEDQVAPKKCGHYEGKSVVSTAEMVGKIKAAVDTRRDSNLMVIARSDARAIEGLDSAIERVNAYLAAGADIGFVEAPRSVDELAEIGRRVEGPALCNIFEGGQTPVLGTPQLAALGFRVGIYPSQTQRAAIGAIVKVLGVLRKDGDTKSIDDQLATFTQREEMVDTHSWQKRERDYLEPIAS